MCSVLQFHLAYATIPSVLQYLRIVQVTVNWILFFWDMPPISSQFWQIRNLENKKKKNVLEAKCLYFRDLTLDLNNILFKIETI